jgi:hypothetical protein
MRHVIVGSFSFSRFQIEAFSGHPFLSRRLPASSLAPRHIKSGKQPVLKKHTLCARLLPRWLPDPCSSSRPEIKIDPKLDRIYPAAIRQNKPAYVKPIKKVYVLFKLKLDLILLWIHSEQECVYRC